MPFNAGPLDGPSSQDVTTENKSNPIDNQQAEPLPRTRQEARLTPRLPRGSSASTLTGRMRVPQVAVHPPRSPVASVAHGRSAPAGRGVPVLRVLGLIPGAGSEPKSGVYTTLRSALTGGMLRCTVQVQCTVMSPVAVGRSMFGMCSRPCRFGSTSARCEPATTPIWPLAGPVPEPEMPTTRAQQSRLWCPGGSPYASPDPKYPTVHRFSSTDRPRYRRLPGTTGGNVRASVISGSSRWSWAESSEICGIDPEPVHEFGEAQRVLVAGAHQCVERVKSSVFTLGK